MKRRTFLKAGLTSAAALAAGRPATANSPTRPPNILWISAEDLSPDLGCYGDPYASTPNLDAFATTAIRYDRAYAHAGVCAPSRSGLITGMYPTAIGTHHMRCAGIPPEAVRCFPEYLRAAGYFCTNNAKTDYQFDPPRSAWDENGKNAHWRNRNPDQPFFAVFNLTVCHESQVRNHTPEFQERLAALGDRKHDPARAPIPPYHADTPATRQDWAQYYDIVSLMDDEAGAILAQLEEDGLADDTIVWFWGDHGRGLTRGKRWLYESGTRVPLLIRVPEKLRPHLRPGAPETLAPGASDDLVSFVDFAPTMLSIAGLPIPGHLQGQAFLGRAQDPPRLYVFGARDRMDEAYDLIRSVRDKQYRYIRNYMPYLTRAQHIQYMDEMPMLQDLRRLHAEGKLTPDQETWFAPRKPLEELYDVEADPHELNDIAADAKFHDVLNRMRQAHQQWMEQTGDLGLLPEPLLDALKWPDGKVPQCAAPTATTEGNAISMACATPGASINFRWNDDPPKRWRLYTGPVPARDGHTLTMHANRIGYKDSPEVKPDAPAPEITSAAAPQFVPPDRLARLRALRDHDANADNATGVYREALRVADPAMRYWSVVGLDRLATGDGPAQSCREEIRAALSDPEAVVRIAAARALCRRGEIEAGLPVLTAVLESGSQSERLHAAIAIEDLGSAALPARPHLERALKDPWPYVVWTATRALEHLG